jgi:gas vesicle protein
MIFGEEIDMSDRNGNIGAFFSGFLFGSLVGAAVALLLAPQSGDETISAIREAQDALSKVEELTEEAKSKATDIQQRGQVILEEQKEPSDQAVKAGDAEAKTKKGKASTKKS